MGLNWPLRGEKHTNWDGGLRAAAFISGGLIPAHLRGTASDVNCHIVDWYPTFSFLAGVSGADDAPIKPLPIDPSDPDKDICAPAQPCTHCLPSRLTENSLQAALLLFVMNR